MIDYIRGRKLLESPFNLTKYEILRAVQEGILVPWESPDAEYIKKHEKHAILGADFERIWRAFPTPELQKRWVFEVLIKKRLLEEAREWLLKSDEEHIRLLSLDWVELSPSIPHPETFINTILP